MRVAMRMYCEVGRDVSMARICEESGIAKGTIFRYFPTRDELFRQAFDACRNRALAMAGKGVDGELGDEKTLKELVRQSFEWPLRFPDEFRFVVMYTDASAFFAMDEDEPGSLLFDALGETRFSELASQHLRPGIDPVLLMRLLSAQINTTCRYPSRAGGSSSPARWTTTWVPASSHVSTGSRATWPQRATFRR